jgi:ornithine cyclodeaminase/alanine dehydrogenase-like protein (mu-crystallin family)
MLVLTEDDVAAAVGLDDMAAAVDVIERAYRQKARGEASLARRLTVEYPPGQGYYSDAALRALVGIVPEMDAAAMRIYPVSHSARVEYDGPRALDYTMGEEAVLYYRYSRQMELAALMAGYHFQNVRTAAPTGVATRWLAREDSEVLGVVGAGRHALWQAAAVCAVRPIREVRVYSPTADHRAAVARGLRERLGVDAGAADSAQAAVSGADVVITVTNANRPVISAEWLDDGTHVNVIARGEIDRATVLRASRRFCSWREQILNDTPGFLPISEMVAANELDPETVRDLDEVIAGSRPGRESDAELTLFLSQGVGIWDAAIAAWTYERAVERDLGSELHLGAASHTARAD